MQKIHAVAVFTAATLLAGAPGASALEIKTGSDKVQLQLKGQINRALMLADDGNDSKVFHVDNDNSSTRVALNGELNATEYLTVGSSFELEWQANPSNLVNMETESISGEFEDRLVEIYLACKKTGRISLGKGKMASEDVSETDLSGTSLAGLSDVAKVGGGFKFYDPAALAPAPDAEDTRLGVSDVFSNMDGLGKRNRLRYDTPAFAGFSLAVAAGEKDTADVGLLYAHDFGGTKVEGAIAWADFGDDKPYSQINGSASVLFPFGLNLTFASGARDLDNMSAGGDDPVFSYGKLGWKFNKFAVGSTAVSVDYGLCSSIKNQTVDQEGTAVGVQMVQTLTDWSTELYAAWRNYTLEDNTSSDYEDISIMMGGARFKF